MSLTAGACKQTREDQRPQEEEAVHNLALRFRSAPLEWKPLSLAKCFCLCTNEQSSLCGCC